MAVDPIKIQTVLRKASDQQLMALLKRPDSIPSMFVQQEIRRRNQARQAAKADMSKMAMAQRPQLTPEMSRMDQPPMPRPQDPMASAIPMREGGSGRLAEEKRNLMRLYNQGKIDIVQSVARSDNGELGNFAQALLSRPKFTDFDMTNPRNNFPGSRLNYSIAPMIQSRNTEFADAKAREKELENNKSEFLNQLEKSGIKAIQSETTPMDLENEFIEGQFDPEGKFDYGGSMASTDPRMRTNTIGFDPRTNIGEMRFPPNYTPKENLSNIVKSLNSEEAVSTPEGEFFGVNPNMVIKKPEMNFATTLAENLGMNAAQSASPFVSKGGVRSMEDKALPLSDTGIPLLQEHMKNLEAQLKAQGEDMSEYNITSNFKPNVPTMDDLKKLIPTTEQLEFAYEKGPGIVLDKAKGILTNPYYDKAIKGIYSPFAKLGGMDQETYNEVTDAALKDTFSNMNRVLNPYADKTGIQTLVGSEANQVTPGSGYTVIDKGSPKLGEPTTGEQTTTTSDQIGQFDFVKKKEEKETIEKADKNTTETVVDYTKPFTDKANMDNAFMDKDGKPLSAGDALKKQYQNLKESEAVNNDGKKTGGVGGAIASQYGKLTDAQNKLIEAMKPNGGDRFWQLVAEFGANLAASDSPNFMQAAGQAMQQTLAEAKDMKKEDRQMLIDQAKVAVDLEFKRAELGLQLARINASGSRTTNADSIRQANYNLAMDKFSYMMKRDASEDEQKNLKIFTDIVNGIDPNTMKLEDYNQRVQTIADNLQVPNIYATGTQQKDTKEIRE